jgi:hypothetical protein
MNTHTPLTIHCQPGLTAVIPEHLREFPITAAFLAEKNACQEGAAWFATTFPSGCTYPQLREKLAAENKVSWQSWIQSVVGGDVATAGDRGTATAGYRGTATAGDRGTATAGDRGTATAGDRGTATAGYSGTATAGYSGTATAGDRGTATAGDSGTATAGVCGTATAGESGTATAGESGVISIQYFDSKAMRHKVMIGYIGEGGLKPGVAYQLDQHCQFVEKPTV